MGIESALFAVGANLVGSAISSDSTRAAANTQADSTREAIAEQRRVADRAWDAYAPYRATGQEALGQLAGDINHMPTAAEVMAQPGYQFGQQQGQLGLDRKAAAAGGRVSGAALKGAARFATDYATTGYNAEYQRRQDRLNRLASLAGIGQTATGVSAQAGQNAGNQISGLISAQGNAAGAAQLQQGNIWGNTVNSLGAQAQRWASQPGTQDSGGYGSVSGGYIDPLGQQWNNPSAYMP